MAADREPDDVECDDEGRGGRRVAKRRGRWRIPARFGVEFSGMMAMATPCAIAWASPKLQPMLRTWLEERISEARISVAVAMPDGTTRAAVFIRGAIEAHGKLVTTLVDSLKGTVFCGKEILDANKDRRDVVFGDDSRRLRDPNEGRRRSDAVQAGQEGHRSGRRQ